RAGTAARPPTSRPPGWTPCCTPSCGARSGPGRDCGREALRAAAAGRPGRRVRTAPGPDTGARSLTSELFDRSAQDDLLQLRNDLMTVYREFSAGAPRLFPLRYARTVPRRPRPAAPPRRAGRPAQARPPSGIAAPQVPVLILPDGPARASVLP